MNAWKNLFPFITIIQCFFHAILNLKKSTTKSTIDLYQQISEKVWQVYHGNTKRFFSGRLRRLQEWAETLEASPLKIKLIKLCAKKWFHGKITSASIRVRAFCLIHNFRP